LILSAKQKTPSLNAAGFLGILATLFKVGCKHPQICPLDLIFRLHKLRRRGSCFETKKPPEGRLQISVSHIASWIPCRLALAPCRAGCHEFLI
jgi:hypothetical protein